MRVSQVWCVMVVATSDNKGRQIGRDQQRGNLLPYSLSQVIGTSTNLPHPSLSHKSGPQDQVHKDA